jgi:hypothetical protein
MIEIKKCLEIFESEDFEFIHSVFPTAILYIDSTIGKNETISKEQKIANLRRAKYISTLEYSEYKGRGSKKERARFLYLNYKYWIETNLSELNRLEIISKLPTEKTAKGNKDLLLNQEQIVILFQYMQKINVFDSSQQLNTKMANGLNVITGWDKEKMRQLFTKHNDRNSDSIQKSKVIKAVDLLLKELRMDSK